MARKETKRKKDQPKKIGKMDLCTCGHPYRDHLFGMAWDVTECYHRQKSPKPILDRCIKFEQDNFTILKDLLRKKRKQRRST